MMPNTQPGQQPWHRPALSAPAPRLAVQAVLLRQGDMDIDVRTHPCHRLIRTHCMPCTCVFSPQSIRHGAAVALRYTQQQQQKSEPIGVAFRAHSSARTG